MWTHRFLVATVCATYVLLLIGGIVHGTGSSLACPDWPLCFGSFFPEMKGNVLIEHGHRLFASGVGVLTLILCGLLYRDRNQSERARRLFHLGVLAVVLVCFQGVLGGLTVIYRLPTLVSSAHLATSMLFLSLLVALSALTALGPSGEPVPQVTVPQGTYRLLICTTLLAYLQIALGGLVRHTGGGLACIDFPLCNGALLPLSQHPTIVIHALHRLLGVTVAILVIATALQLYKQRLRVFAVLLPLVVLLQVTLGVLSVLSYLGLLFVTAHLGGAALLLSLLIHLCVRLRKGDQASSVRAREVGEDEIQRAVTA